MLLYLLHHSIQQIHMVHAQYTCYYRFLSVCEIVSFHFLIEFNCEQFMDKYQKLFIDDVAAKKIAKKLFISHAIDQDLLHYIENSGPEEAVEELFLHLKYNADSDVIRKVCRIMVTTRCGSKMSELGELMIKDEELPPAIGKLVILILYVIG